MRVPQIIANVNYQKAIRIEDDRFAKNVGIGWKSKNSKGFLFFHKNFEKFIFVKFMDVRLALLVLLLPLLCSPSASSAVESKLLFSIPTDI